MKNTSCLCRSFLFLLLIAVGCSKDDGVDPDNQPLVTQIGIPTGTLNHGTFNETGGTLTSADGVVQLVIPAGALSHEEVLSIQALSNFSPGGVGNAYRLLPGGLIFHQPVTLIFNYADSLVAEQQFLGLAYQDSDNTWLAPVVYTSNDVTHTVSVQTRHFSDWSLFEKLAIKPRQSNVVKGDQQTLKITYVGTANTFTDADGVTLNNLNLNTSVTTTWQVSAGSIVKNGDDKAIYTAPPEVPSPNPVEVTVTFTNFSFDFHGSTYTNPTLHALVNIIDDVYYYQVILTSSRSIHPVGTNYFTETDWGSFRIALQGDTVFIYSRNNADAEVLPGSLYDPSNECTTSLVDPGDGPFNMPDSIKYGGVYSTITGLAYVGVAGIQYPVTTYPTFSTLCPGSLPNESGGETIVASPASFSFNVSLPYQEITSVIPGGGAFPDGFLKIAITRI